MPITRRECVAGSIATGLLAAAEPLIAAPNPKFKAIAFDAFPIFDPRPVFRLAEELFPGKGAELSNAWRSRQFARSHPGKLSDSQDTRQRVLRGRQCAHAACPCPLVGDVGSALTSGGCLRKHFSHNLQKWLRKASFMCHNKSVAQKTCSAWQHPVPGNFAIRTWLCLPDQDRVTI